DRIRHPQRLPPGQAHRAPEPRGAARPHPRLGCRPRPGRPSLGPPTGLRPRHHRGALGIPRAAAGEVAARALRRARLPHPGVRHGTAAEGAVRGTPEVLLRHLQRRAPRPLAAADPGRPGGRVGGTPEVVRHAAPGQPVQRDRREGGVHPRRRAVAAGEQAGRRPPPPARPGHRRRAVDRRGGRDGPRRPQGPARRPRL
ncbi:MAG: hypothetical protein AVDCRST_MAG57-407, partial [uncultured Blastococcus sp.]